MRRVVKIIWEDEKYEKMSSEDERSSEDESSEDENDENVIKRGKSLVK